MSWLFYKMKFNQKNSKLFFILLYVFINSNEIQAAINYTYIDVNNGINLAPNDTWSYTSPNAVGQQNNSVVTIAGANTLTLNGYIGGNSTNDMFLATGAFNGQITFNNIHTGRPNNFIPGLLDFSNSGGNLYLINLKQAQADTTLNTYSQLRGRVAMGQSSTANHVINMYNTANFVFSQNGLPPGSIEVFYRTSINIMDNISTSNDFVYNSFGNSNNFIFNISNGKTFNYSGTINQYQNFTVNSGATFNYNGGTMTGQTLTNNSATNLYSNFTSNVITNDSGTLTLGNTSFTSTVNNGSLIVNLPTNLSTVGTGSTFSTLSAINIIKGVLTINNDNFSQNSTSTTIATNSSLNINGRTLFGALTLNGTLTLSLNGVVNLYSGTVLNNGTLNANNGTVMGNVTNQGTLLLTSGGSLPGNLSTSSTSTSTIGAGKIMGTVSNQGTMTMASGGEIQNNCTTSLGSTFTMSNGGTLKGTLDNAGTFSAGPGTIEGSVTNSGTLTLASSGKLSSTLGNSGTFAVGPGTVNGNVTNSGTMTIASGGSLLGATYTGATGSNFTMSNGGTVAGAVTNAGTMTLSTNGVLQNTVNNTGTINVNAAKILNDITNSGTLNLISSSVIQNDNLVNSLAGTLDPQGATLNTVLIVSNGSIISPLKLVVQTNKINTLQVYGSIDNVTGVQNTSQKLELLGNNIISGKTFTLVDFINIKNNLTLITMNANTNFNSYLNLLIDSNTTLTANNNCTISGVATQLYGTLNINGTGISLATPLTGGFNSALNINKGLNINSSIDNVYAIATNCANTVTFADNVTAYNNFTVASADTVNFTPAGGGNKSLTGSTFTNNGTVTNAYTTISKIINNTGASYTFKTKDLSGESLTNAGIFNLNSATLSSAYVKNTGILNFTSSSLNAASIDNLNIINNSFSWTAPGVFNNSSTGIINGVITGNNSSQTLNFNNTYNSNYSITNIANIVVNSPGNLTANANLNNFVSMTINNGASFTLSSSNSATGTTFTNRGTSTLSATFAAISKNDAANATLNINSTGLITGASFANLGTVNLSAGGSIASTVINLNGGSLIGAFNLATTTNTVNLNGGTVGILNGNLGNGQTLNVLKNYTTTAAISSIDNLKVQNPGTTLTFNHGLSNVTSMAIDAGTTVIMATGSTLNGSSSPTLTLNGTMSINANNLSMMTSINGSNSGILNINNNFTSQASMTGSGVINVTGSSVYNNAYAVSNYSSFNIASAATANFNVGGNLSGSIVNNSGINNVYVTLAGNYLNSTGAILNLQSTALLSGNSFTNQGTLNVNAGASIGSITFTNNGGTISNALNLSATTTTLNWLGGSLVSLNAVANNNQTLSIQKNMSPSGNLSSFDNVNLSNTNTTLAIASNNSLSSFKSLVINNGCVVNLAANSSLIGAVNAIVNLSGTLNYNGSAIISNVGVMGSGTSIVNYKANNTISQTIDSVNAINVLNTNTILTVSADLTSINTLTTAALTETNFGSGLSLAIASVANSGKITLASNLSSNFVNSTATSITVINPGAILSGTGYTNYGTTTMAGGSIGSTIINNFGGSITGNLTLSDSTTTINLNGGSIGVVNGNPNKGQTLNIMSNYAPNGTIDGVDNINVKNNGALPTTLSIGNYGIANYKNFTVDANANLALNTGANFNGANINLNGNLKILGTAIALNTAINGSPSASLLIKSSVGTGADIQNVGNIDVSDNGSGVVYTVSKNITGFNSFNINAASKLVLSSAGSLNGVNFTNNSAIVSTLAASISANVTNATACNLSLNTGALLTGASFTNYGTTTMAGGSIGSTVVNNLGGTITGNLNLSDTTTTVNLNGGSVGVINGNLNKGQTLNIMSNYAPSGTIDGVDNINVKNNGTLLTTLSVGNYGIINYKNFTVDNKATLTLNTGANFNGANINLNGNLKISGTAVALNSAINGSSSANLLIKSSISTGADIQNVGTIDVSDNGSGVVYTVSKNITGFTDFNINAASKLILSSTGSLSGVNFTNNSAIVSTLASSISAMVTNANACNLTLNANALLSGASFTNYGTTTMNGGSIGSTVVNNLGGTISGNLTLSDSTTTVNLNAGSVGVVTGTPNKGQTLNFIGDYAPNGTIDSIDNINVKNSGALATTLSIGNYGITNYKNFTVDANANLALNTGANFSGTSINLNGNLQIVGTGVTLSTPIVGTATAVLTVNNSITTGANIQSVGTIDVTDNGGGVVYTVNKTITGFNNFTINPASKIILSAGSITGNTWTNSSSQTSSLAATLDAKVTNNSSANVSLNTNGKFTGPSLTNYGNITMNGGSIGSVVISNLGGTISGTLTLTNQTTTVNLSGGSVGSITGVNNQPQTLNFLSDYTPSGNIANIKNIFVKNSDTPTTLYYGANTISGYTNFTVDPDATLALTSNATFSGAGLSLNGNLLVKGSNVTLSGVINGTATAKLDIQSSLTLPNVVNTVGSIAVSGPNGAASLTINDNVNNFVDFDINEQGAINLAVAKTLKGTNFSNNSSISSPIFGTINASVQNSVGSTLDLKSSGTIQGPSLSNSGTILVAAGSTISSVLINNYGQFTGALSLSSTTKTINLNGGNFTGLSGTKNASQILNILSNLDASSNISNIDYIHVQNNAILSLIASNALLGYKTLTIDQGSRANLNNSSGTASSAIINNGTLVIPLGQTLTASSITNSGTIKGGVTGAGAISFTNTITVSGGVFAIPLTGLGDDSQTININGPITWTTPISAVGTININGTPPGNMILKNSVSNTPNFNVLAGASLTLAESGSVSGQIKLDGSLILEGGNLVPPSGTLDILGDGNAASALNINANVGPINSTVPVSTAKDLTDIAHISLSNNGTVFELNNVLAGFTDVTVNPGTTFRLNSTGSLNGDSFLNNGLLELRSSNFNASITGGDDADNTVDIYTSITSNGKLSNISNLNLKDNGLGTTKFNLGHSVTFNQFNIEPDTTLSINTNGQLSTNGLSNNGSLILNGGKLLGNVSAGLAPNTSLSIQKDWTTNGSISDIKTISVATPSVQKWAVAHAVSGFDTLTINANANVFLNSGGSLLGTSISNLGTLKLNGGDMTASTLNNGLTGLISGNLNLNNIGQSLILNGGKLDGNLTGKVGFQQSVQLSGSPNLVGLIDGIDNIELKDNLFILTKTFTNYKSFLIDSGANLQLNTNANVSGANLMNNGRLTLNGGQVNGVIQGNNLVGTSLVFNAQFHNANIIKGIPSIQLNANAIVDVSSRISDFTQFTIASNAILNLNTGGELLGTGISSLGTINLNGGKVNAITGAVGSVLNANANFVTAGTLNGLDTININTGISQFNHLSNQTSNFNVLAGAELKLNSPLSATAFNNAGKLSLANTQTLTGNYSQASLAELNLSLQADNTVSLLNVVGSVNLAPNARINIDLSNQGSLIQGNDVYPILQSTAAINATDISVGSLINSAVISFAPEVNGNVLNLVAKRLAYESFSNNDLTASIGQALDNLRPEPPNELMRDLFNAIDRAETPAAATAILTQLAPVMNAGQIVASFASQNQALDKVASRMEVNRMVMAGKLMGYVAGDELDQSYALSPIVFGGAIKQQAESEIAGYTSQTIGLGILSDTYIAEGIQVGVGLSMAQSKVNTETRLSTSNIKSLQAMTYASYEEGAWFGDVMISGAVNHYDELRKVEFANAEARAKYNGGQYSAKARVGYAMSISGYEITPMTSLHYSHLDLKAYQEKSSQGIALHYQPLSKNDSLQAGLGFKINYRGFGLADDMLADFHVMTYRELRAKPLKFNVKFLNGGPEFVASGLMPKRNSVVIGSMINLVEKGNSMLSLSYDLELKPNYVGHAAYFKFRW